MKKSDLIAPALYNITSEFEKYAADEGRKAVILEEENGDIKEITYTNLIKNANKAGNILLNHGLKRGDKIMIMLPRCIEAYELYIAALKTGMIIIPSSEMLRTKDLQFRISHGEIDAVVATEACVEEFKRVVEYEQLAKFSVGKEIENWVSIDKEKAAASDQLETVETSRDDIAILSYTSGTTGNPKAVIHSHGWGFAHMSSAPRYWLSIQDGDTVWATAAPGWQKWVWSPFLSIMGMGATAFVYSGRFDAAKYLELLEKHQVNVLCCTPTEYRLMAKLSNLDDYNLNALHSTVSAGEPLNREVIDKFRHHFDVTVRDGYGQTESTLLLGFLKGMEVRPGSMGKPTPGNDVVIIDEDGKLVKTGEVGDIAIPLDTAALFKGYYKDEEKTKRTQRGDYYVTGDQASMDEDGYFWFEGRSDDIIISSGYTIGPFEVEDTLVKHPDVKECAVVASPDPVRGNVVKAFVILQDNIIGNSEVVAALQSYVKHEIAPYKYPRKIEFVSELPKTSSGKIRRVELRQKEYNNSFK
ncbi:Acetyl-coenzyme A synthetase [Oceanobacillus oncorhynchi]|uniref:Acetyl-coenzyme A synthetase n=1 Tax=Oceanobacillus oncorhynchi TaxID=545501 RepID=A0A0A1M709_9BACI|nr:acyl--CoA ligase [Oceanobacillus oncorhynchi]CEI81090.1 Acetyl-coenzyme A synthetase [Oceanobacillus oncorhynchi]